MADIRINALTSTAATTASDDYFAVDGSSNGTRKLSAFSPTLGGNLTVSGTGTIGGGLNVVNAGNLTSGIQISGTSDNIALDFSNTGTGGLGAAVAVTSGTSGFGQGKLVLVKRSDNTSIATFDIASKAATISGNLTVSGGTITGGTSGMSLASGGTNQNITLTPSGTGSVAASSTAANVLTLLRDTTNTGVGTAIKLRQKDAAGTTVDIGDIYAYKSVATAGSVSSWIGFGTRNAGTLTDAMFIAPSGNVVLGSTATDSGNGKLQLATHTTSAGGIGFGTDVALFHRATGVGLTLSSIGSTTPYFTLDANGTNVLDIFGLSSDVYFDQRVAGKSLFFRTNGATLALTLDSSQNATFAGTVTTNKAYQDITSGLSTIYVYSTSTATQDQGGTIQLGGAYTGTTTIGFGGLRGSKESTTAGETGGQLEFFTRANGGAMARRAYISSTGNATFTGSIAIGNTVQTAVGVASTHKVTISIGGSTYYLLATNV